MTEKRFTIDDGTIRDNLTAIKYYCLTLSGKELCDFLNWQHEKIEQLEAQLIYMDFLKDENKHMEKVLEENKQLKSTLAYRSNQLTLMEQLIDDLGSDEMKRQMEGILNE